MLSAGKALLAGALFGAGVPLLLFGVATGGLGFAMVGAIVSAVAVSRMFTGAWVPSYF